MSGVARVPMQRRGARAGRREQIVTNAAVLTELVRHLSSAVQFHGY